MIYIQWLDRNSHDLDMIENPEPSFHLLGIQLSWGKVVQSLFTIFLDKFLIVRNTVRCLDYLH